MCLLSVKMYNARGFSLGREREGEREGLGGREKGRGRGRLAKTHANLSTLLAK